MRLSRRAYIREGLFSGDYDCNFKVSYKRIIVEPQITQQRYEHDEISALFGPANTQIFQYSNLVLFVTNHFYLISLKQSNICAPQCAFRIGCFDARL